MDKCITLSVLGMVAAFLAIIYSDFTPKGRGGPGGTFRAP